MSVNNKIAIFPGTFDPFTLGHHDIVTRGLKIFDKIFIAIGNNPKKDRYFNVNLIKEKIDNLYKDNNKINVINYNKLTASLAKDLNANFILRGLRNTTDFEFENSISQINKDLNSNLETEPELINNDPVGDGWMVKAEIKEMDDSGMSYQQYESFIVFTKANRSIYTNYLLLNF